jgi:hypothetical protein
MLESDFREENAAGPLGMEEPSARVQGARAEGSEAGLEVKAEGA